MPFSRVKALFLSLHERYGPIYTLYIGSKPLIVIASHSLAHQALIDNSVIFADRPQAMATDKFLSCDQQNISSAFYSPTWLRLRRNLTYNILHTLRIKSFACARKWALDALINRLKSHSSSYEYHHTKIREHIQHALYSLFAFICFGEKLEDKKIQDINDLQRRLQLSFDEFKVLNLFPSLGKFVFHKRWEKLRQLRQDQEKLMVPLIKARKAMREGKNEKDEAFLPYVDTLFDLQLKEENRKLEEKEIVTLCSEFFTGGIDTTSTTLEWIMANLVKHPHIQDKLFKEIKGVVSDGEVEIKDGDLRKMPYLRAVILESLRRHPPSHFLIPHTVTKNVVLGGF
ncbi:cytochrome P450 89A2-like [Gossypium arboreum]|uniref:cytochrome P450 89A2-like n=1 Tax=Gossypium arboreum TaxID=29729 RepID=UPI0022F159C5|nr:cytochrome P450 89A2-like [Gossypium arboreum]